MKYSTNLPARTYTTTIGDFNIIDLCSYYTLDDTNFEKVNIPIDKSQTLVEASYTNFRDVDAIWLFLFANKKINPFTLTKLDTPTALAKVKNYEDLNISEYNVPPAGGPSDAIGTKGGILTEKVNNSGNPWDYGSTGNFSLTGGFALIDGINSFTKSVLIKESKSNLSITTSAGYFMLNRGSNNSYSIYNPNKDLEIVKQTAATQSINTIKYEFAEIDMRSITQLTSPLPYLTKGSGSAYTPEGTGITSSFEEDVKNRNIDILGYDLKSVNYSNLLQVNQNYVV
jgi:hypothetical protein